MDMKHRFPGRGRQPGRRGSNQPNPDDKRLIDISKNHQLGYRIASLGRAAAQDGIKALMAQGFHKPGDIENRLGYYVGQIPR